MSQTIDADKFIKKYGDWYTEEGTEEGFIGTIKSLVKTFMAENKCKNELKPCPFRIYGERRSSATVPGEYTYIEQFMQCMGDKCACYEEFGDEIRCKRDMMYLVLASRKKDD